jgi:hypothetical protein
MMMDRIWLKPGSLVVLFPLQLKQEEMQSKKRITPFPKTDFPVQVGFFVPEMFLSAYPEASG